MILDNLRSWMKSVGALFGENVRSHTEIFCKSRQKSSLGETFSRVSLSGGLIRQTPSSVFVARASGSTTRDLRHVSILLVLHALHPDFSAELGFDEGVDITVHDGLDIVGFLAGAKV